MQIKKWTRNHLSAEQVMLIKRMADRGLHAEVIAEVVQCSTASVFKYAGTSLKDYRNGHSKSGRVVIHQLRKPFLKHRKHWIERADTIKLKRPHLARQRRTA